MYPFAAAQAAEKCGRTRMHSTISFAAAQAAEKMSRRNVPGGPEFAAAQAAEKAFGTEETVRLTVRCRTGS